MAKFNTANIFAGLKQAEKLAGQIDTAYDAVILTKYIKLAAENKYSDNDTEEDLIALAADIDVNGLINALVVRKISDTEYILISGERRFLSVTRHLNWKQVRCRIYENITETRAQLMLHIANLQTREYTASQKLTFYEDCHALLQKMKSSGEYKGGIQEGIASMLNVTDRQVRTYKTIVDNTTPEQRQEIAEGKTSLKAAYREVTEKNSGTGSGTVKKQSPKKEKAPDEQPAAPQADLKTLKEVLVCKLDCKEDILFYCLNVPTTAEGVRYLNMKYLHRGGTVAFSNGSSGFYDWKEKLVITKADGLEVMYSVGDVDACIREMIRCCQMVTLEEQKHILSAHFTQLQLEQISKQEGETI